MLRLFLLITVSVSLLSGCAFTRTARLYPANDLTSPTGVLEAVFTDSHMGASGNGSVLMTAPSGEVFKGEYSIVRGGAIGFGSVFGSVYSRTSSASYSGGGAAYTTEGKSQGVAFAHSDKGTRMDCEFFNDNWSGHGFGACKTSTGLLYKLAY